MNRSDITVFLGCDHAGYAIKERAKDYLVDLGIAVSDKGAFIHDLGDDYPDFIAPVAAEVSRDPSRRRGIVFGGSGQGEAMISNAFPGVRCAVYYDGNTNIIELSRSHNDANILSLGARFVSEAEVMRLITQWIDAEFPGDERHSRRIAKLEKVKRAAAVGTVRDLMSRSVVVMPAVLERDFTEAQRRLSPLQGAALWAQIDIMDGSVGDGATFDVDEMRNSIGFPFFLEAHLMVHRPEAWIQKCADAGFQRFVFHPESSDDPTACMHAIRKSRMQAGIAVSPSLDISEMSSLGALADYVMIMGVAPGKSGQEMLPETFDRIKSVREAIPPAIRIGVDGGVRGENIPQLLESGADTLVTGSSLFGSSGDPAMLFEEYLRMTDDRTGSRG